MLSRRLLLTSSLALLGGCAARTATAPTTPPPTAPAGGGGSAPTQPAGGSAALVGPHANWNGTAGSGAPAPVDPTRTGAKAIGRIATCPGQRVNGQLLLKIPCDAFGGIAQVNLSGDCAATTISAMSLVAFTDVNGVTRKEFYHAAYLDASAFVAKGGTAGARQANIYAEIVPTNPAVQRRVLSFHFYPEATATDGTYNVGSGQPYATIKAALNQAQVEGRKAPLVQIKTTGFYEMEDSTWGIYAGGKGFAVITHDPGVTATIRRAAPFNPTNQASWNWTPGWDGIEFRGSGIVIDQRNTTQIVANTKPFFFNGCKITNSIGTRDTLYWNKSPHPGWGPNTPSWWQYYTYEFGKSPFIAQLACIGGTSVGTFADVYTGTPLVYGAHDRSSTSAYMRTFLKAMTVRYTGSGSATIEKTGGNGSGTLVLNDGNHPGAPLTIALGAIDNLVEISTVVATINARSGWSATAFDTTRAARHFLGSSTSNLGTQNFSAQPVTSADFQFDTMLDFHGDGTQTYGGQENFIYWNWILDGTDNDLSSVLFFDGQDSALGDRDMSFVNCAFIVQSSNPVGLGGSGSHHKVLRHLTMDVWVSPQGGTQEVYTEMTNSLVHGIGTGGSPSAGPAVHFYNNMHTVPNGAVMLTGSTYTGNVSLGNSSTVSPRNFLTNPTNSDFTPKGVVLTTLYPSTFPYDQRGIARSASDVVGAWSKNTA